MFFLFATVWPCIFWFFFFFGYGAFIQLMIDLAQSNFFLFLKREIQLKGKIWDMKDIKRNMIVLLHIISK